MFEWFLSAFPLHIVSSQTSESSQTRIRSDELIRRGSALVYVIEIFELILAHIHLSFELQLKSFCRRFLIMSNFMHKVKDAVTSHLHSQNKGSRHDSPKTEDMVNGPLLRSICY